MLFVPLVRLHCEPGIYASSSARSFWRDQQCLRGKSISGFACPVVTLFAEIDLPS